MKKTNSLITATTASMLYFIIFIMLKYSLQNKILDWQSGLLGALVFWFFIFLVHHFLEKGKISLESAR